MAMSGSGVQMFLHLTPAHLRSIRRGRHPERSVVFAAVRGTTTFRTSSGALIVTGTTQITGATSAVFVSPQDLVKILFSGAAFSGPFAGSGVLH